MRTIIDTAAPDIERVARKRAGAKLGWYIHATVYVCVNAMLMLMAAAAGRNWAFIPAAGWGLGLASHGLAVFFATGGMGLHESLLKRERDRLQVARDAW